MPETAQKIRDQLGLPGQAAGQKMTELKIGQSSAGVKINRGQSLFPKIENAD
jgi:methionyl-tRNA synthetase